MIYAYEIMYCTINISGSSKTNILLHVVDTGLLLITFTCIDVLLAFI